MTGRPSTRRAPVTRFPLIRSHVLLGASGDLAAADAECAARLSGELIAASSTQMPDDLLMDAPASAPEFASAATRATAIAATSRDRLRAPRAFAARSDRRAGAGAPRAAAAPQGATMSGPRVDYDFAVLRVVPRVHLGAFVNVGVVLHARTLEFLALRVVTDERSSRRTFPASTPICSPATCARARRSAPATRRRGRWRSPRRPSASTGSPRRAPTCCRAHPCTKGSAMIRGARWIVCSRSTSPCGILTRPDVTLLA